jgi:hypothetical protein
MSRKYPYHTFTIVLWSEALEAFGRKNDPLQHLVQHLGHWVSVIGVVEAYDGKPQIAVEVPSQITRLKDESEAKGRLHAASGTIPVAVPAQVKTTRGSASPATVPMRDVGSKEAQVFNRLYGKHGRSTSSQSAPARSTRTVVPSASSRQKPAGSKSTVVPSSATNQKRTTLAALGKIAGVALVALCVLWIIASVIGPPPSPGPQESGTTQTDSPVPPTAPPTSAPPPSTPPFRHHRISPTRCNPATVSAPLPLASAPRTKRSWNSTF